MNTLAADAGWFEAYGRFSSDKNEQTSRAGRDATTRRRGTRIKSLTFQMVGRTPGHELEELEEVQVKEEEEEQLPVALLQSELRQEVKQEVRQAGGQFKLPLNTASEQVSEQVTTSTSGTDELPVFSLRFSFYSFSK